MQNIPTPAQAYEILRSKTQSERDKYLSDLMNLFIVSGQGQAKAWESFANELQKLQYLDLKVFFDEKLKPIIWAITRSNLSDGDKASLSSLIRAHHNMLVDQIIKLVELKCTSIK